MLMAAKAPTPRITTRSRFWSGRLGISALESELRRSGWNMLADIPVTPIYVSMNVVKQKRFQCSKADFVVTAQWSRHREHWKMPRMPAVDRNILRLAVYEMLRTDTPPAVAIDDALELARRFAGRGAAR